MKIQITESQLKKLQKVINEGNTAIDDLNNLINPKLFTFEKDFTVVTFNNIILEGDIDDGLSVIVNIDKVFDTYRGEQDVTNFAMAWAIWDYDTGEDQSLGMYISIHIANVMNKDYTKYLGVEISEWDVILN